MACKVHYCSCAVLHNVTDRVFVVDRYRRRNTLIFIFLLLASIHTLSIPHFRGHRNQTVHDYNE